MQPASKCLDIATLDALALGHLDRNSLPAAEAHLASCAVCQRAVAQLALGTGSTLGSDVSRDVVSPSESDAVVKASLADVPATGTVIDQRYRVERMLGQGGMGSVVAATHLGLQQRVAMKVLRLSGSHAVARFLREGRLLAQLNNPHIVRVFDSGQLGNGLPYIVMEYLDGSDLARLMRQRPLSIHETISYVRQACVALEAAHNAGIVHRDLKPSNLFLARHDTGSIIKVLDFGISKSLRESTDVTDSLTLTGTGDLIGSPRYMSPEQLQGRREIDLRTDIWSLGVILYELLTGVPPFPQRDLASIAIAVAMERPRRLREVRAEIPSELDALVMRCLEKEPAQRFASVAALSAALAAFDAAQALPVEPAAAVQLQRRSGLRIRAAAAALIVVGAGLALRWATASSDAPAPEQRKTETSISSGTVVSPQQPPATPESADAAVHAQAQELPPPAAAPAASKLSPAEPASVKSAPAPKPKPKPKEVQPIAAPAPAPPPPATNPGLTGLSETPD